MTGNWSGTAQGISLVLQVAQTGVNLAGTATAFGGTFPVTGTNSYPNVELNGSLNGVNTTFAGAFADANTIPGTINALGSSLAITIVRQ